MDLLSGSLFHNRYRLVREVGRGSFGEVWLAKDILINIEVAIKIYVALDSRGIDEFMSEYKNTYELSHRNLMHAHHFDVCDRRPYLVMPYCSKGSAEDLIGNIDEITVWYFIRDVASGLSYLHEQEPPLIHQDIKPANILIDSAGHFLITDFGISKRIKNTLRKNPSQTSNAGTISYMAPERFSSDPIPIKANDIWSLGATLYELITGDLPFCGMGGSVLNNEDVQLPKLSNNYSENLNEIIKSCLVKETWERPTAKELSKYAEDRINGNSDYKPWLDRNRKVSSDPFYIKTNKYHAKSIDHQLDNANKTRNDYTIKRRKWLMPIIIVLVMCFATFFVLRKLSHISEDKKEYLSYIKEAQSIENTIDNVTIDTNAVYNEAMNVCDSVIGNYNKANEYYNKAYDYSKIYERSLFKFMFSENVNIKISNINKKINNVENNRRIIQKREDERIINERKKIRKKPKQEPTPIKEIEPKNTDSIVYFNHPKQTEVVEAKVINGFINGHEYVDLGLSVKWATCNLGASSPEEHGSYYSWGELEIKDYYISDSCITFGQKIPDIAGVPQYDVARNHWGATWRMPTESEFKELINKCSFNWITINNMCGYNIVGPNGNSIFIPAAGYRGKDDTYNVRKNGQYWTSTPNKKDYECAQYFFFNDIGSRSTSFNLRSLGLNIRPVSD